MAGYNTIRGLRVKYLSADPATSEAGQVWYNSTTGNLRVDGILGTASWASGGNLNQARQQMASGGVANAGWITSGFNGPSYYNLTEEYNGSSWSTGNVYVASVRLVQGAGPQTAAYATGGFTSSPAQINTTGEYDGTNWTAGTVYPTVNFGTAGVGTQTAGLTFSGGQPGGLSTTTKEYDGSSWTAGGARATGVNYGTGNGTQTAALSTQGNAAPGVTNITEEYNGTSWTGGGNNTFSVRGSGSNGPQTAAISFAGSQDPGSNTTTSTYDGSSWTSGATTATARQFAGYSNNGTSLDGTWFAGGENESSTVLTTTEEYNLPVETKNISVS
jgi:hypothetical protein